MTAAIQEPATCTECGAHSPKGPECDACLASRVRADRLAAMFKYELTENMVDSSHMDGSDISDDGNE